MSDLLAIVMMFGYLAGIFICMVLLSALVGLPYYIFYLRKRTKSDTIKPAQQALESVELGLMNRKTLANIENESMNNIESVELDERLPKTEDVTMGVYRVLRNYSELKEKCVIDEDTNVIGTFTIHYPVKGKRKDALTINECITRL